MTPTDISSPVNSSHHSFAKSFRRLFATRHDLSSKRSRSGSTGRVVSLVLVVCLLSSSTPAAPQTIVAVAKQSSVSLMFWFYNSGLAALIQEGERGRAKAQETQRDRDAKVSRLQIFPGDLTIDLNDRVSFSAVAYDLDNVPVSGVKIKWSGQSSEGGRRARLSPRGEFEATAPGSFSIVAEGAGRSAQVTVVVRPGVKRNMNLTPTRTSQTSTRDVQSSKVGATREFGKPERSTGRASKTQKANDRLISAVKRNHTSHGKTIPVTVTPATPQGGGGGWNSSNYWSADDPENGVGNAPGATANGGAGSGNFQFSAPILNLPGRGFNITLGLAYNSRVWNKAGSQISYDNDRGWPAPGFSLGFGKLLGMGVYNGGMLVDADGTRHSYTGSLTVYNWGTYFVGHTIDGSFIDYWYWSGTGGGIVSAQARFPNGTVINYGAAGPGAVYPTSIEDANGNYIVITYVNNAGPRIQTITDTLGRVVNFHYDYNNLLTAVTAPGLNGGAARTLVRLHYHQHWLNYAFNGLTPVVRDSYPWVIDAIYYPGTGTGYWFGDADSYSSYGMLAKVVEQRNMGFSASSLNDMGSVWQGATTRSDTHNYPLSPDYSLTDAPTYTTLVQSWTRDGSNFNSATTTFAVNENSSPRTVAVTLPNGTKNTQYSYNSPGSFLDGLVYYDETRDASNTFLQSSSSTWAQGAYSSPRPTRIEFTDERGQMRATEFTYGSVYNQVTEVRNYDYGGTALLRATRTQYQNSSLYTNRHIFNLPLSVEVYASDYVTRVSRTDYQYDGQTLTQRADVIYHDMAYNPYAEAEGYCYWDYDWSDPDCTGSCYDYYNYCDGYCPQYYVCPYDPSTEYRGNVTQVTTYANAINLTGAVTETRRYDIAGTLVQAGTSCCQQTTFNYTVDTQYAYPQSKTRGSATDPYAQVTTSATYDYNTGLILSATDANGRQSQTTYDSATLRQMSAISPTGSHTDYGYDDGGLSVTQTTYLASSDGGGIADKNVKLLTGLGQVRQEQALGANNLWDFVDTTYDNMGQMSQQSRPYRSGETPQWTTFTYDALGRAKTVTAPDGSITQSFYNEVARPSVASSIAGETTRVQDPWGRERWGRADSQGRLVEVVEPDPLGGGSVANNGLVTTYGYDTLGNLTQVNQGSQTRLFKYDSLGRMTAQKLAEPSATLNDAGTYVGTGTWSDVFTYDDRSNLTSRTDARGVKTIYTYNSDPLDRLQSVSWDTSGFGDSGNPILPAATVTYQYRQKSSPSDLKDITKPASITTSGVSTESYGYDAEGRVSSKTLTLTSRSSYPFVTDYIYDSLDRPRDVRYPAEYGNGSAPRKLVHHDYDVASRLSGLTVDGQSHASNVAYNAASQTTQLNIGTGTNQVSENYSYNAQTSLLDAQTVVRGGSTLLNLSYDYAGANGKRTGQLAKISNNLDHTKDRGYEYDALGRLQRATGGQSVNWAQRYTYDRYGNRQNAFSYTAEQYVRNFYQSVLVRQPSATELQTALSTLQTAYTQGPTQFLLAMGNLGEQLFTSQEYLNRNRSDRDFVYDCYKAYLFRDPDQGGWDYWTSVTPQNGRANIRLAFVYSQEFNFKMSGTSPYSPSATVPRDGWEALSFNSTSNQINSPGYAYDAAGNQTRALISTNASQRFQYDAANRLVKVKADDNVTVLATYTYGDSNERLIAEEAGLRTYNVGEGGNTIAEYVEAVGSTFPVWSKSYIYLGGRLLSTLTPNGGGEAVQYHHPDRLGTRIVSNPSNGTSFEQVTLPFGTALNAESTGATNRRFTSYNRSATTGLDYALNRHFDSQQGRFTQVDPVGMGSASPESPQTLNLYAYCANDPINQTDPSGLGFFSFLKKIFRAIAKFLTNKWVLLTVGIALGALAGFGFFLAATEPGISAFALKAAIALSAMSALLIVGAFHPNVIRISRIVSGIVSSAQTLIGLINPHILGTPPWNPASGVGPVANFMCKGAGCRRRRRPGAFQTINAVAIAALKAYDVPSISINKELAGSICEYPNGELIYTTPNVGGGANSGASPCPAGTTRVAAYHTHAAYDPNYDNENFSSADKIAANNMSINSGHVVPLFLATPNGVIKRFDPAVIAGSTRGRVATLKTKINTFPF